jgi:hypothetical protein
MLAFDELIGCDWVLGHDGVADRLNDAHDGRWVGVAIRVVDPFQELLKSISWAPRCRE